MVYELPQFQNQQQLCLAWITKRFMIMLMYRRPNGISFLPVCRQFSPLWARVQVILIQALCQDSISVRLGSLRAQSIYSVVQLPRLKKKKKKIYHIALYVHRTHSKIGSGSSYIGLHGPTKSQKRSLSGFFILIQSRKILINTQTEERVVSFLFYTKYIRGYSRIQFL